jgi:hypothetical protein
MTSFRESVAHFCTLSHFSTPFAPIGRTRSLTTAGTEILVALYYTVVYCDSLYTLYNHGERLCLLIYTVSNRESHYA